MNKTYRSVWSEVDQTWVAAPETAATRGKSSRRLAVIATGAVGVMAGIAPAASFAATPGTVGAGGLEICSGASGYSWGNSGGSEAIDCSVDGKGTTDGLAFSLNNAADTKGGYGFGASTARISGYQNGTLYIGGASIMVYGPTTFNNVVTMSNQKIVQLAPGLVSATSTEAVNGSQLYSAIINGTVDAVTYDTPAHNALTLGGVGSSTPVALHNVAAGALSPASTDAVNGAQLYATNQNVSDLAGSVTNIAGDITNINGKLADAVAYDSSAHDSVTLGGTDASAPVALHNVANATSNNDAVNLAQLEAAGLNVDTSGNVTNAFVAYDDSSKGSVTLGGVGSSTPVALHNVAAGELSANSTDAVNGAQLYATNQNVSDLAGSVTNIAGDITNINGKLADAVAYDSSAHDSVTLGGTDASAPVALHNVANATSNNDAVSLAQLEAAGLNVDTSGNVTNAFVAYDDSSKGSVTFGGVGSTTPVALHNVAAGELSANSTDAVNGAQLYATNQNVSDLAGSVTNIAGDITNINGKLADAVAYDSSAHDSVTLGGTDASAPVALHNVAAGDLSPASTDAVNGAQLYATNQNVSDLAGSVTNIAGDITNINGKLADAVAYDSSAHDSVTLGGTDASAPVALHNVANATSNNDAVNLAQLEAAGLNVDTSGNVTNAFVAYDDSSKGSVTLGGVGSSTPVALHNVAAGAVSLTSNDAVNGSQLYGLASSAAQALGGNTTVNKDGSISAPSYVVGNGTYSDVGSALAAVEQTASSGDAVQYDSTAHTSVTLGGMNASAPVALHNVAAGELSANSTDAVNGAQLYATNQNVSDLAGSVTNIAGDITNINGKLADAVAYDSSAHDSVTLGGTDASAPVALHNVANATSNNDAVNLAQLEAAGLNVDTSGNVTNAFVAYDDSSKGSVTLGGVGSSTPVALHNVAAGELSANSTDAVNGAQLYATNQNVSDLAGSVTNIAGDITNINGKLADAVAYDSSAHDSVTLGGTDASAPVALHNVANATSNNDAVNLAQLEAAGLNVDTSGNVTNAFVAYDDSSKGSVTLGGVGSSTPVALHNVAAGAVSLTSNDAVNGSQLYGLASSAAQALGGNTTVNKDGSISAPSYVVGKGTYSDVGSALAAVEQTASSGDAVQYDSTAHTSVTLGGMNASAPVALHNVAAGELSANSTDAVNGAQLYATNQNVSDLAGSVTNIAGDITNINGKLADAVAYDSSAHDSVTLGGTDASAPVALHNVANATSNNDAVNLAQLEAAGLNVDTSGNVTNAFVAYDDSSKGSVTLGGAGSSTPVALHNVAAGELSANSTDAVNGAQLYATNQNVSDLAGSVTNIAGDITNINGKLADAVAYDSSAHDSVTLGGTDASAPVALHNVANATSNNDAVNLAQLEAAGLNVDTSGNVTNAFVAYDDSSKGSVTLGGVGSSTPVALHNVAAGAVSLTSNDAVNGSQLYGLASSAAQALGGNTTVNKDGSISAPSYVVGNGTYSDVGSALAAVEQTASSGDAVQYDSTAHTSVTLGGTNASAPVALHNVANATSNNDAVNLAQLEAAGLNVDTSGNVTNAFVAYDDSSKGSVTFGGVGSTTPVALHNVAAGELSANSTDAVNGAQLFATNQTITNLQGTVSDAVLYDSSAHAALTLGGTGSSAPVALHNVANGNIVEGSTDAVNAGQLYDVTQNFGNDITNIHNTLTTAGWGAQASSSNPAGFTYGGFITDANGKVSNPAVLYVPNTVGTANAQIVLDPGQGNSAYFVNGDRSAGYLPAGTIISNVHDGIQNTDAANVGQVASMIASATGGPSLFAAHVVASAAPDAGSGVDSSGLTTSYRTAAYYSQVSGLGDNDGLNGPSDMARAAGAGSIAIGSNAYTPGINGVAVGVQAYTSANDAVALGSGSVADKANTVSVGNDGTASYTAYDSNGNAYTVQNQANTRRIVNMAAGQDDTDAVNVSQLRGAVNAIGGGAAVNADGSITAPTFVVGGTTVNTVSAAITNLDSRVTQNTAAIASLQGGSSASSTQSPVQSSGAVRLAASQVGVSDSASTTDADAVHYDSSAHDSITLSNAKLTGLTNANLSADSTDAVTGQQLYATNQQLSSTSQQVTSLTQAVQNISTSGSTAVATNTTSGAAAASGSQSVAVGGGAVATGINATAIGDKANASADNSVAIGANSIANRADAVSVGAEGSERQIVNVAAGTSGTDAVNLNQLNDAMTQQSNTFNQQITGLQNSINTVSKNAYAGVAAAMAMPNLTPSGPGRVVVAAGGGYYMGGSAAAVGATYRSQNMRWLVNGGVSVTSTGTAAVRAQVGYEF